jgi:hypothetical protein
MEKAGHIHGVVRTVAPRQRCQARGHLVITGHAHCTQAGPSRLKRNVGKRSRVGALASGAGRHTSFVRKLKTT